MGSPTAVLHGGGQLKTDDTPHEEKNDALLKRPEAAEVIGRALTYVDKLARDGKIESIVVDGRRMFTRNSLETYIEKYAVAPRHVVGPETYKKKKEAAASKEVGPVGEVSTSEQIIEKLEANLRELKYALSRESKSRKRDLAAKLQALL